MPVHIGLSMLCQASISVCNGLLMLYQIGMLVHIGSLILYYVVLFGNDLRDLLVAENTALCALNSELYTFIYCAYDYRGKGEFFTFYFSFTNLAEGD